MLSSIASRFSALRFSIVLCSVTSIAWSQVPRQHAKAASYGNLPLLFETNQGQADPSVQAIAHGQGYTLFLRSGEAVFTLPAGSGNSVLRMQLVGANPRAAVAEEDPQITKTNYFLGNDPGRWHTGIPNYSRVRYRSVYQGIDQVYYGNQRQLEHDFVVAPHADPRKILLALQGAKTFTIDPATGDLILDTGAGVLRLQKPLAYQQEPNRPRTEVPSGYKLLAGNRIAFDLGSYDRARPLIIDPVLSYSTYLGGKGNNGIGDQGNGIAIDNQGYAYIVGTAYSTDFPVTRHAFEVQDNAGSGDSTVFVSKLNPAGTVLIYSTYLGGSGGDLGYSIAVDTYHNAYITGATRSVDFPVTCGSYLPADPTTTTGATAAFVTKLTPDGSALIYSTFLGGSGSDVAQAIAVDRTGDAYITGYTNSPNFPVSSTAFQPALGSLTNKPNAFVSKLNPVGTALLYSTYLGGNGFQDSSPYNWVGDFGNAIAIDSSGDAFIAGTTSSSDFPVTAKAVQSTLLGPFNGFVTELNPAGSAEIYSTFLGGSGYTPPYNPNPNAIPLPPTGDTANAIVVDASGYAYIAGTTTSTDFPVTAGVLQGASSFDTSSGFVAKLNTDGSALVYSTYLEGVGTSISGLAVDSSGTAYVAGASPAPSVGLPGGFQTTPDAIPPPVPAPQKNAAFVVKLNSSGTALNYATLLGGERNDGATALALDTAGNVYVTGGSASLNFPVTKGTFQTTNRATSRATNAFVAKLALASEANQTTYAPLTTGIATTLTGNSSIGDLYCYDDDSYAFFLNLTLTTAAPGPPPTGTLVVTDNTYFPFGGNGYPYQSQLPGNWAPGPLTFAISYSVDQAPWGPIDVEWTASYSGDAIYAASSLSGSATSPNCPVPDSSRKPTGPLPLIKLHPTVGQVSGNSNSNVDISQPSTFFGSRGPKFIPPAVEDSHNLAATRTTTPEAPACLAPPLTAPPTFSPAAGTYASGQTVRFTDTVGGAIVYYYTTDGTTPTTSSTQYKGPIYVAKSESLQAIAVAVGYAPSAVATAPYVIETPAAAPTFTPAAGTYGKPQFVTLASTTPGAIYYTTDGSTPTDKSPRYTGKFYVGVSETIHAVAYARGYDPSHTAAATYSILPPTASPTFSPAAGTYGKPQFVTLASTTPGAIYYTTDGSSPTDKSTRYTGRIYVSASETIKAIAYASGHSPSDVVSAVYKIGLPAAVAPNFSNSPPAKATFTIR
jgi:hypothetical protein